jgi:hypothetical protein
MEFVIAARSVSGKVNHARKKQLFAEGVHAGVDLQLHVRPIIQAGPLQVTVREAEPQRSYEMERRVGGRAGPGNVSGILRDLRLVKDDAEDGVGFRYLSHVSGWISSELRVAGCGFHPALFIGFMCADGR